ncbi:hypothetical protein ARMSODRAFT_983668 [Armillaria solidipes]|uniref:Uncharacterized protein n=1 Tax=Armillaria solidipes TaxID=1076256 RepID=A0A2H3AY14_9AGAR|nr:hypothetical protein ARMSODRAFT_983668 [Armillaria solidipes]
MPMNENHEGVKLVVGGGGSRSTISGTGYHWIESIVISAMDLAELAVHKYQGTSFIVVRRWWRAPSISCLLAQLRPAASPGWRLLISSVKTASLLFIAKTSGVRRASHLWGINESINKPGRSIDGDAACLKCFTDPLELIARLKQRYRVAQPVDNPVNRSTTKKTGWVFDLTSPYLLFLISMTVALMEVLSEISVSALRRIYSTSSDTRFSNKILVFTTAIFLLSHGTFSAPISDDGLALGVPSNGCNTISNMYNIPQF